RLRDALALAARQGMAVRIAAVDLPDAHPNTARLYLRAAGGRTLEVQGCSVGGGSIRITGMDGMEVLLTGESPTLIGVHRDEPGAIAAVTEALAGRRLNISGSRLDRQKRGGNAVMVLELDGARSEERRVGEEGGGQG